MKEETMDPIKAQVMPANQGDWRKRGRGVQVVADVPVGGVLKRVTLHIHKSGGWRGLNPDKVAVARLDAAEKLEGEAVHYVEVLTGDIARIEASIKKNMEAMGADEADKKTFRAERKALNSRLKETATKLAETKKAAAAAKAKADSVRAEVPRTAEFVFA